LITQVFFNRHSFMLSSINHITFILQKDLTIFAQ